MFKLKYTVTILDSKWNLLKKDLVLNSIPRKDEYIFMDGLYYLILNLVHSIENKHIVYVIIDEIAHQIKK